MSLSEASNGSVAPVDDRGDTSPEPGDSDLAIEKVREIRFGYSSHIHDDALGAFDLSDVGDAKHPDSIRVTRISVVSNRKRSGGGETWSSVMSRPAWIQDYSVRTLCDSLHSQHDEGCSFAVDGDEQEDSEDLGYYFKVLKLFLAGGLDRVPIKRCMNGKPTSPYSFSLEALRQDSAKLAPQIYMGPVSAQSAETDFHALWAWLKDEANSADPECSEYLKKDTTTGLSEDLEKTIDKDDKEVLDSAIKAIAGFDFSSKDGKPIELVRRDKK